MDALICVQAWLLGTERREQVADAVNAAILVLAEGRDPAESCHPEVGGWMGWLVPLGSEEAGQSAPRSLLPLTIVV